MKRAAILILGLIGLLGFTVDSQAQGPSTYVQWGLAGTSSTNGFLDASVIPTSSGTAGVRYGNVNGLGYDVVVITSGLTEDGEFVFPWDGDGTTGWWYQGSAADKAGKSIPYATVDVRFYLQGTNVPFGVTGVNFSIQNAKIGERYRNFNYWDTVGSEVAESFTNYNIFSYANGTPDIHLSDSSIDSGIPYVPGNYPGDWIDVDMSPMAISGFSFQTGRVDSSYGSNIMTNLGYLVPTGQLLIQTGSDTNITAGPCFVSTGSNAVLTPISLAVAMGGSNAAVITGNGISQNIVIDQDIVSNSGNSLAMCASQNILSATSVVSLSSTSGNAGSISLTAVQESVLTQHMEATASSGTGGSITINAGNNIGITGGIDSSASSVSGQSGNIALEAGNSVTADTIRSGGGGGGPVVLGTPGNITLTASNSINVGAFYDDSGPGANPSATFTAPFITIGQSAANASDFAGTLYMQYAMPAAGATIAISGSMVGTGGVVIDAGTGSASLYTAGAGYTGETDMLSGTLAMRGNSLAASDLVLDNTSSFLPGVETPGGYVAVNSLTDGTNATVNIMLTSTTTYDQVQATEAANLNGVLNVTLAGGFTPDFGTVFQVLTSASVTGEFGTYQGLRLSDRTLQPVYTGTSVLLVTSTTPTGASQPLQSVPSSGLDVPAGGYYNGLTMCLQTADGFTAAGTLIDGTASADTTVMMCLAASGTTDYQLQGSLGGFLLNILGTGGDKYVVQLDYNEAAALAAAGDERQLFLASSDGSTPFANAVLANTDLLGEPNNPTEVIGPYDPTMDFQLGYYGVDTVNNRVWAVVDYGGLFGLGALNVSAIPAGPAAATEPASGVLALSATLNALVNFNGFDTSALFESGTDPALAGATVTPAACGNDADFVRVNAPVTSLLPDTTYYYRVDAVMITGTEYGGILSFSTPLSGVNYWRYSYFGTYANSGNAADTANPSGDGIENLLKYATGMSPLVSSTSQPAVMGQTGSGDSAYLTLTFNEIADPNLTYSVQASDDLSGTWTTIWSSTGASNTPGPVTVQDIVPISDEPSRFLRLQVSY